MVSTLKVNTIKKQSGSSITIGESGDTIDVTTGAVFSTVPAKLLSQPQGTSSSPVVFTVTVAAKTSGNVYNGAGSTDAYYINGLEAPSFFINGNTVASYEYYYRFDQSDASNATHPLLFYLDSGKTQIFSANVTTNGTPGSAGAYTQIQVGPSTPHVLYYQCSSHGYMGNRIYNPGSETFNTGGAALRLPGGTGNPGQFIGYGSVSNGVNDLSWGTVTSETKPTISSISPSVIENTQTAVTITGTNFVSVPIVEAINSTGAITAADSVSFGGSTSIVANFTLPVDGTYFIRVENNDGNAVRSGTAILTVSDAPAWVTAAGSLGTFGGGESVGTLTLTATNSTGMAIQSGALPGGLSLNSGSGSSTITGTESGATSDTTYNFTIRATDAEGQTADRAFSIDITLGIGNSMRFD
jgi:hypothetical protein